MPFIAPLCLVLAIGLSWPRFLIIFRPATQPVAATAPSTMIASVVNISSVGFAVADNGPLIGMLIIVLGLALAYLLDVRGCTFTTALSCIGLAIYLQLASTAAF